MAAFMFKAIQCRIRIMRTLWSKLFIVLQLEGEKVEAVTDFFFEGLQNHCGW